jgi:GT2 family glycosyltransferase
MSSEAGRAARAVRPRVDVVVPFHGGWDELTRLRAQLAGLELGTGDTVLVVDNTPAHADPATALGTEVPVLHAAEMATPGYARNRGAERGEAEWLLFIDADTVPPPDLLDRYFEPEPGLRTALLAGGIRDEEVPPDAPMAQRYAQLWGALDHERTLSLGKWAFPQSANIACRREAFAAVGGFRENIRAAEDADLTFRLQADGWEVESRAGAWLVHRSRRTVRALVAQRLVHGAGGAWLDRRYPGSFPARRRPGLIWWGIRHAARVAARNALRRDRDELLLGVLTPIWELAFEFGRSLPNERPLPRRWRRLWPGSGPGPGPRRPGAAR